jgi:hypothetical protein
VSLPGYFTNHRSLANFRRPQCVSFRDGLNSRSTWRFNARITPIRANIVGAAALSDQQKRFHRGLPFGGIVFRLGELSDVERGVAQGDELLALG